VLLTFCYPHKRGKNVLLILATSLSANPTREFFIQIAQQGFYSVSYHHKCYASDDFVKDLCIVFASKKYINGLFAIGVHFQCRENSVGKGHGLETVVIYENLPTQQVNLSSLYTNLFHNRFGGTQYLD
jgi:hypothetical protein